MSRARLTIALLASGCGRDCAGPGEAREVLRHQGDGWAVVASCRVATDVALLRASPGPLLRGCSASSTLTVRTSTASSPSALPGGYAHARDCAEARRFCATLRGEVSARATPSGTVVGVAARGARETALFAVTPEGSLVRYPADLSQSPLRSAVSLAPDLDALVLRMAGARRLGPAAPDSWAVELAPAFTERFVRAHREALLALARSCALRRVLVARMLRVDEAVRDALTRDPGAAGCHEVRAALGAPPSPGASAPARVHQR